MAQTIFALATAAGRAAVAVIRISGPLARPALEGLTDRLPRPRFAGLRLGLGVHQIGHRLGLGQIQLAVVKGAPGELAGFGQAQA